jgi:hypothetical protein
VRAKSLNTSESFWSLGIRLVPAIWNGRGVRAACYETAPEIVPSRFSNVSDYSATLVPDEGSGLLGHVTRIQPRRFHCPDSRCVRRPERGAVHGRRGGRCHYPGPSPKEKIPPSEATVPAGSGPTPDGCSAIHLTEPVDKEGPLDHVLAQQQSLLVGNPGLAGAAQPSEEIGPGGCQVAVCRQHRLGG